VALTDRELSPVLHPRPTLSGEFRDAEQAMTSPGLFGGTISREELKDSAGLVRAKSTRLRVCCLSRFCSIHSSRRDASN